MASLRVQLLDRPGEEFEVAWTDVAGIRVYEELLLAEAGRLTAAGNFDEAYDYFAKLSAEYPSLPGLKNAVSDYLRRNALALYQAGEHDRALALLVTLYQRNPALRWSGERGANRGWGNHSALSARRKLLGGPQRARTVAPPVPQSRVRGCGRLAAAIRSRRARANWLKRKRSSSRSNMSRRTKWCSEPWAFGPSTRLRQACWSGSSASSPSSLSACSRPRRVNPVWRIDSWAALRTSRLVQRLLVEEVDFGTDGGIYRSPFGELALDDTGRELSLTLNTANGSNAQGANGLSPDALSRFLLSMAERGSPRYRGDFANLLGGVSMAGNRVQLELVRAHVRPEALLRCPPPSTKPIAQTPPLGADFVIDDFAAKQVVFAAAESTRGSGPALQAIVEQRMPDDEAAVSALVAGDIDVLDRVPPWHVERLRGEQAVRVVNYRLPTVHMLIPNSTHPLLARREFRRALCFGIDRKWIVERVLAGGAALPGYEVLSGPVPGGLVAQRSDPVRIQRASCATTV